MSIATVNPATGETLRVFEPLTGVEHVLGRTTLQVVFVLDRDDWADLACFLQLLEAYVGNTDVTDLPCLLAVGECADRFSERHLGIGRMQLIQVDPVPPQALEAAIERFFEVLRTAVAIPGRWTRSKQPAFRRDDELLWIGV